MSTARTRRTRTGVLAAITILAAMSGCSIKSLEGVVYNRTRNTCDLGCNGDGVSCVDGACRAAKTNYNFLAEVRPPLAAHYAGGVTFTIEKLGDNSGRDHDLGLPSLATLTITLDGSALGVKGPIATSVQLTLVDAHVPPNAASGKHLNHSTEPDGGVRFQVPEGDYDAYITPLDPAILAVVPPITRRFSALKGAQKQVLVLGSLKRLDVTVMDETGSKLLSEPIDGHDVAVIDKRTGRLVSTLAHSCTDPAHVQLRLSPGVDTHTAVLRFSPPQTPCGGEGTVAPLRASYDFDLDTVDFAGLGSGTVNIPTVATLTSGKLTAHTGPVGVSVNGNVQATETGVGLLASLVFRSRVITAPPEWKTGTGFYEASSSSTRTGGFFPLLLPSGVYDVQIVPDSGDTRSSRYAVTVVRGVDISSGANAVSQTFFADAKNRLLGTPVTPNDDYFQLGTIDITPSAAIVAPSATFSALARSVSVPLGPRLDVFLDPGTYDVVVRVPDASGFPWIVRQGVQVTRATKEKSELDLKTLRTVPPVIFTGRVLDPNGDPVARAYIRARAKILEGGVIDTDPTTDKRVIDAIDVGETFSREDGSYTLVVPSSLEVDGAPTPVAK